MGCGSSKAVVAVAPPPSTPGKISKSRVPSAKDSVQNFQASSSRENINTEAPKRVTSKSSVKDIVPERTESKKSLRSNVSRKSVDRLKSGVSVQSKDSGVFEERNNSSSTRTSKSNSRTNTPDSARPSISGESNRVASASKRDHPRTPTKSSRTNTPDLEVTESSSRKSSSKARAKLLRIESTNSIEDKNDNEKNLAPDFSMVSRPKSRFGNVAFDLEFPETNNMRKKQPLPRIKRSGEKKRRTKEDLERKMNEVAERRKLAELEKLMKAKRAQHSILNTPVVPFDKSADSEDLEQSVDITDSIDTVAVANDQTAVES